MKKQGSIPQSTSELCLGTVKHCLATLHLKMCVAWDSGLQASLIVHPQYMCICNLYICTAVVIYRVQFRTYIKIDI